MRYYTRTKLYLLAVRRRMPSQSHYRKQIVQFGQMLHQRGYVAAMDGNLSVRLDDRRILSTPTSICKGMMRPSDLVIVDVNGERISGRNNVSSEIAMHLLIYRLRPDVRGIVHAHPRTATGFAAAGMALNKPLVCEVVIGLGSIPLAKYGTPGTPELTDALEPLVPQYDAILMSNHGVVTYGADLHRAYMKMETVEHFAQIALISHLLGSQQPLGDRELEKLMAARAKYQGCTSVAPMPLAAIAGNGGTGRNGHKENVSRPSSAAAASKDRPGRRGLPVS